VLIVGGPEPGIRCATARTITRGSGTLIVRDHPYLEVFCRVVRPACAPPDLGMIAGLVRVLQAIVERVRRWSSAPHPAHTSSDHRRAWRRHAGFARLPATAFGPAEHPRS
jgi:hypothetical protein